ncbi:hypothetical protein GGI06_004210 [Coemansia sp. S85]|nr:hypothetical protein GGI06_004210 [Coemansia sp. S85]
MLDKPWMQTWVTRQHGRSQARTNDVTATNTIETACSRKQRQPGEASETALASSSLLAPPPPLILPVQSAHLSHLPFCGAKNAYAVGGRLLLDPSDRELADALGQANQQQPWMVLGVLSGDFPRLHICDQAVVFGRSPDCAICLDDAHISLRHCTIDRCGANGSALLTNHSSNGTFVNSQRVKGATALSKGDSLVLLFDRIDSALCDRALLGQQLAVDNNGYPVLVGYRVIAVQVDQGSAC